MTLRAQGGHDSMQDALHLASHALNASLNLALGVAALFSLQQNNDSIICLISPLFVFCDVSETTRATKKVDALWRVRVCECACACMLVSAVFVRVRFFVSVCGTCSCHP